MEKDKPVREIKMLIGLPGSGKSTYLKENPDILEGYTFISVDGIAQERSKGTSFTAAQIHDREYDSIINEFNSRLKNAVERGDNIFIEGVNAAQAKRENRLAGARNSNDFDYKTTAIIIIPPPEEVRLARIQRRIVEEGRFSSNISKIEMPKKGEFDNIIYIENNLKGHVPSWQKHLKAPADKARFVIKSYDQGSSIYR
jgi:predicted kinase